MVSHSTRIADSGRVWVRARTPRTQVSENESETRRDIESVDAIRNARCCLVVLNICCFVDFLFLMFFHFVFVVSFRCIFLHVDFIIKYFGSVPWPMQDPWMAFFFFIFCCLPFHNTRINVIHILAVPYSRARFLVNIAIKRTANRFSQTRNRQSHVVFVRSDIAGFVFMSDRLIVFVQYQLYDTDSVGKMSRSTARHTIRAKHFMNIAVQSTDAVFVFNRKWTFCHKHSHILDDINGIDLCWRFRANTIALPPLLTLISIAHKFLQPICRWSRNNCFSWLIIYWSIGQIKYSCWLVNDKIYRSSLNWNKLLWKPIY